MNSNWLKLPILYNGIYPTHIKKMADKIGVTPEEIAESKGIDGNVVGKYSVRREVIQRILSFTQIPESPNETVLEFIDGSFTVVYMEHDKLIKIVDEFLKLQSDIELIPIPTTQIQFISKEEFEEMGENPYEDE